MDEHEQMSAVRWAFREGHFILRWHAHIEMLVEGLGLDAVRMAGADAELLEDYPEREHGHTKLLLGWTERGDPVHLVLNVASFESDSSEPVVLVTVYRPAPPWWTDERSRRVR